MAYVSMRRRYASSAANELLVFIAGQFWLPPLAAILLIRTLKMQKML